MKAKFTQNGVEKIGVVVDNILKGDKCVVLPPDGSYLIKTKKEITYIIS